MGTDIDQGTAALLFFINEYAPGRNGSSADRMSLCIVNIAQLICFADTL